MIEEEALQAVAAVAEEMEAEDERENGEPQRLEEDGTEFGREQAA